MLTTGKSIMLGRPAKGKKARVDFPEKGTTPESGGGTATKSRCGRDSRQARTSCRFFATPTPVQKENRDTQAVPPQSLERVRTADRPIHPR